MQYQINNLKDNKSDRMGKYKGLINKKIEQEHNFIEKDKQFEKPKMIRKRGLSYDEIKMKNSRTNFDTHNSSTSCDNCNVDYQRYYLLHSKYKESVKKSVLENMAKNRIFQLSILQEFYQQWKILNLVLSR